LVLKRVLRTVFFQQYLNLNGLFANSRRFKGLNMPDLKRWFLSPTVKYYCLPLPPTVLNRWLSIPTMINCLYSTPTVNKRDKNLIFNPKFQALLTQIFANITIMTIRPTKKYLKNKQLINIKMIDFNNMKKDEIITYLEKLSPHKIFNIENEQIQVLYWNELPIKRTVELLKHTALTLGIVTKLHLTNTVEKVTKPYLTEEEVETILLDEAEEKRMEEKNYNDERNEWKRLSKWVLITIKNYINIKDTI